MKKLLFIALIFLIGCSSSTEPETQIILERNSPKVYKDVILLYKGLNEALEYYHKGITYGIILCPIPSEGETFNLSPTKYVLKLTFISNDRLFCEITEGGK